MPEERQVKILLGMIKSKKRINLKEAAKFLKASHKELKELVYMFVGAGTIEGTWESDDVFVVDAGLDDFIDQLNTGFENWGPETQFRDIVDNLSQTLEKLQLEKAEIEREKDKLQSELEPIQQGKLLVIGLEKAGKTSLLNALQEKGQFADREAPTLGVNIVQLVLKQMGLVAYDVGGQKFLRDRWFTTLKNPNAIVFVVDIAEEATDRWQEVCTEFDRVIDFIHEHDLDAVPLLVAGNKTDLTDEVTPDELARRLGMDQLEENPKRCVIMSAKTGEGVRDGFQWLVSEIVKIP